MDGLIPFTKPIREHKPRAWFEAMEVDAMDQQGTGDSDSIEEKCKCTALQASGRGEACYYCAKEGHFLRSCLCKAAGLLRSTPTKEDRGSRGEERQWNDQTSQPPTKREWSPGPPKGNHRPPPKGNQRESWREGLDRGYKPWGDCRG